MQDYNNDTMAEETKPALNEISETNGERERSSGRLSSRVESSQRIGAIASRSIDSLNSRPKLKSHGLVRLEVRKCSVDCRTSLQLLTLTRRQK
jgi:hypothetical protein